MDEGVVVAAEEDPARRGESLVAQIAKDFRISESCLRNWLAAADARDGNRPGVTKADSAELREAKKRVRLLEQENEIVAPWCDGLQMCSSTTPDARA